MAEDPELRRLRDQVRNLDAQLAFARRGTIGGGGGGMGCALGAAALVGLLGVGGAVSFLLLRTGGRQDREQQAQADMAARADAARQRAVCEAEIADLRSELSRIAMAVPAPSTPAFVQTNAVYGAHVTVTSGASHVHVGDACRLDMTWTSDPNRYCRVFVECGDRRVYGSVGEGWLPCSVSPDQGILHAEDDNPTANGGDPRITFDRSTSTAVLGDDGPAWTITLAVDATPESG
jgi:hypothetical protein